jgi:TRAP-type C4-dicarboxylate transport system substrate-binding protein
MVTTSASPLTGLVPEFNVFDLPFIVPSTKAADAIFDGPIGAKLAAALEPKGIKLLAYYENGLREGCRLDGTSAFATLAKNNFSVKAVA